MTSTRFPYKVQCLSRTFLSDHSAGFFPRPWHKLISPKDGASLLLLLGDIGVRQSLHTHEFIEYCSKNWERTIWIEGDLELERNMDGMPPRTLPWNVDYVNQSRLICLDDSQSRPTHLYATPLRSYRDLKYLKSESARETYDNYLLVASYQPSPYSLKFYPGNCIGWFQSFPQFINPVMSNMYYDLDRNPAAQHDPKKCFLI